MEERPGIYRLKPMVMARLCAEVTVLAILVALPFVLLAAGNFMGLGVLAKVLVVGLALVALCVLPSYGFITHAVRADAEGLMSVALFKKQFLEWSKMKSLKLTTSWGWKRYVVASDHGDLSFPVWLGDLAGLRELIRGRLPNRGSTMGGAPGAGAARTYKQDNVALLLQFGQIALSFAFIALFWTFFGSLFAPVGRGVHQSDGSDKLFILAACLVFTGFMLFRAYLVALSPVRLTVGNDGLSMKTLAFEKAVAWSDVKEIGQPLFFLPDGLLMKSQAGWYLISDNMECSDELQEDLLKRMDALNKTREQKTKKT